MTRYAAEPLGRAADGPSPRSVGSPSAARRVAPPLLLAGGVLAASVALHLRDPHRSGSWGWCPWLVLTGTSCPGCGGLRAVSDLTRGEVAAAASSNLLLLASLPLVALAWSRSVLARWQGVARPLPRGVVRSGTVAVVLVVLAFWVVRNLPVGAWLAP